MRRCAAPLLVVLAVLAAPSPALAKAAFPGRTEVREAVRYLEARRGLNSFALIDSRGRLHAYEGRRAMVTASVVKAMLLVAQGGLQLTDVKAESNGNGVRISAKVAGQSLDQLAVRGNYQADVAASSSHPAGNCNNTNATTQQPQLLCSYPSPGIPPGIRFVLDLLGTAPCPQNGAFLVQGQSTGSNSSTAAVVQCTPSGGADLALTLRPARQSFIFRGSRFLTSPTPADEFFLERSSLRVNALITNHGPAVAQEAVLSMLGAPALPERATAGLSDPLAPQTPQPGVQCGPTACELGNMAPGDEQLVTLVVGLRQRSPALLVRGRIAVQLIAVSSTYDPGPRLHQASYVEEAGTLIPDSEIRRAGETGVDVRLSKGALSARVAILRSEGRVIVEDNDLYIESSAARCRWLRSIRIRFRAQRGRSCNRPVWLKTRRRGRRATLRFRRRLPPGRYTVLSAAAGRRGSVEGSFSRRDGNRRTFTVKRPKRR